MAPNLKRLTVSVSGIRNDLLPSSTNYGFPSKYFYKELADLGIDVSHGYSQKCMIAINHNRWSTFKRTLLKRKKSQSILIRTEPISVYPAQYTRRVESKYGLILSPGGDTSASWLDQYEINPYVYQPEEGGPRAGTRDIYSVLQESLIQGKFKTQDWANRSINLLMIASNKVSPLISTGYDLRRKLVRMNADKSISIFGALWEDSIYKKFRHSIGVLKFSLASGYFPNIFSVFAPLLGKYSNTGGYTSQKYQLIGNSKFMIIIENSDNCVTEKIFDAFISGCIPLYRGPNLSNYGIPGSIYIKTDGSYEDIILKVSQVNEIQAGLILEDIFQFLSSDNFKKTWTEGEGFKKTGIKIRDFIDNLN